MRIRITLGTEFQFKLTISIFWTNFAEKESFQSKTDKLNITIKFCIVSVGTKFQLKLTILIFWIKFEQKGYFQS